jgi:hypothetical protein
VPRPSRYADERERGGGEARAQGARPAGRVKVVERFAGRRVRHRTGMFRRVRSLIGIMIIGIVIAAIVAAAVAVVVGSIALAVQHALGN